MSKIFEYLPDLKIVREKPRMEKPEEHNFYSILHGYKRGEYFKAVAAYESHLKTLKSYPAQGFGPEHEGRDLITGKDFELVGLPTQSQIPVTPGSLTITAVPLEDKQSSQKKLITEIMEEDQKDGLYGQLEVEKQGGQDDTAFYRGDFQAYADRILRDRGASNKDVQWGINETINELKSKYIIKRKP